MYIRTKDGRILDFDKLNEVSKLSIDMAEEPIRESKNLEELCDCFVIDDKRNNVHYLMDYYDVMEELQEGRFHSTDEVYGAIWTSKGLIYVAKMNESGDLELI